MSAGELEHLKWRKQRLYDDRLDTLSQWLEAKGDWNKSLRLNYLYKALLDEEAEIDAEIEAFDEEEA